jgi:hypothetical protein
MALVWLRNKNGGEKTLRWETVKKWREILTEGEHAQDDGLGDEVDGVAGTGKVQLALPVILIIVNKLLADLRHKKFFRGFTPTAS